MTSRCSEPPAVQAYIKLSYSEAVREFLLAENNFVGRLDSISKVRACVCLCVCVCGLVALLHPVTPSSLAFTATPHDRRPADLQRVLDDLRRELVDAMARIVHLEAMLRDSEQVRLLDGWGWEASWLNAVVLCCVVVLLSVRPMLRYHRAGI